MKLNEIYNGDCLELMTKVPDKSVDMILCDLPYQITACKWDVIIPFEPLWKQYERIIKDNGAIVLTASQPFTSALVMSNPKMFRYEWIWEKEQGVNFMLAKKQPLKSHENICVFSLCPHNYFPVMSTGHSNYVTGSGTFGEAYGGRTMKLVRENNEGTRYPKTVIRHTRQTGLHPTQKPVALFEYLIKTYTNEGETVMDNCSGSGTTAIACIRTNRKYICMEKDKTYFEKSMERVAKELNPDQPKLELVA